MRRVSIFLLVLVFATLLLILPILAQDAIYFTAINNTLLELNEKTMPVKVNGTFYVPNSVFNSTELGTYCVYSRSKQLVMLSDLERTLYFDMGAGTCYDDQDESYPYPAIYHNDTAYLPALFTAFYFGCDYNYLSSDYAPIIRMTKGNVLSNDAFIRGASALMAARLAQYQAEQETPVPTPEETFPVQTAGPAETPPVQTAEPIVTQEPVVTPQPTASPRPDRSHVDVYLAFLGLGENSETCAELLCDRGYIPCFFVRSQEILQYPDLIRKLGGMGCGIGILFEENLAEEYAIAAQLLREAARTVTFLAAAAEPLPQEVLDAAEGTGLKLWCAEKPASDARTLIAQMDGSASRCDLVIDGSISKAAVTELIYHIREESYTVKQINELTKAAPIIADIERVD